MGKFEKNNTITIILNTSTSWIVKLVTTMMEFVRYNAGFEKYRAIITIRCLHKLPFCQTDNWDTPKQLDRYYRGAGKYERRKNCKLHEI